MLERFISQLFVTYLIKSLRNLFRGGKDRQLRRSYVESVLLKGGFGPLKFIHCFP